MKNNNKLLKLLSPLLLGLLLYNDHAWPVETKDEFYPYAIRSPCNLYVWNKIYPDIYDPMWIDCHDIVDWVRYPSPGNRYLNSFCLRPSHWFLTDRRT
jgi:hypothetical protein